MFTDFLNLFTVCLFIYLGGKLHCVFVLHPLHSLFEILHYWFGYGVIFSFVRLCDLLPVGSMKIVRINRFRFVELLFCRFLLCGQDVTGESYQNSTGRRSSGGSTAASAMSSGGGSGPPSLDCTPGIASRAIQVF